MKKKNVTHIHRINNLTLAYRPSRRNWHSIRYGCQKKVRIIDGMYFRKNPPESKAKRAKKRVVKAVERILEKECVVEPTAASEMGCGLEKT